MTDYCYETDTKHFPALLFSQTYFRNAIPEDELYDKLKCGNSITFALDKKHKLCVCENGNFRYCDCINERGEKGIGELLEDKFIVTITDLKLEYITKRNAIEMLIELKYNICGATHYFLEGFEEKFDDNFGIYFEIRTGS